MTVAAAREPKAYPCVVDSLIVALSEYDTDTLKQVAEYAEGINPTGWLGKIIREYVSVWR